MSLDPEKKEKKQDQRVSENERKFTHVRARGPKLSKPQPGSTGSFRSPNLPTFFRRSVDDKLQACDPETDHPSNPRVSPGPETPDQDQRTSPMTQAPEAASSSEMTVRGGVGHSEARTGPKWATECGSVVFSDKEPSRGSKALTEALCGSLSYPWFTQPNCIPDYQ